jgi:hypothetical protein
MQMGVEITYNSKVFQTLDIDSYLFTSISSRFSYLYWDLITLLADRCETRDEHRILYLPLFQLALQYYSLFLGRIIQVVVKPHQQLYRIKTYIIVCYKFRSAGISENFCNWK